MTVLTVVLIFSGSPLGSEHGIHPSNNDLGMTKTLERSVILKFA